MISSEKKMIKYWKNLRHHPSWAAWVSSWGRTWESHPFPSAVSQGRDTWPEAVAGSDSQASAHPQRTWSTSLSPLWSAGYLLSWPVVKHVEGHTNNGRFTFLLNTPVYHYNYLYLCLNNKGKRSIKKYLQSCSTLPCFRVGLGEGGGGEKTSVKKLERATLL